MRVQLAGGTGSAWHICFVFTACSHSFSNVMLTSGEYSSVRVSIIMFAFDVLVIGREFWTSVHFLLVIHALSKMRRRSSLMSVFRHSCKIDPIIKIRDTLTLHIPVQKCRGFSSFSLCLQAKRVTTTSSLTFKSTAT